MSCDVLVVSPHPDDAELFCGGMIRKSITQGNSVTILDLTRGELSSRGDLETRARESTRASEVLGVTSRFNLELPDGGISSHQLPKAVEAIRHHRPKVVLLPYWEERHPDHVAASKLFSDACFYSGVKRFLPEHDAHTPQQVLYYQFRFLFSPSFIVDISDVVREKYEAIRCYSSQLGLEPGATPSTLLSSPLTLTALEARDRLYGVMIGAQYGEPVYTQNTPAVENLSHFVSNHLSQKTHLFLTGCQRDVI